MSKVIHIDQENPSAEAINLAATVLRDGGIVVFPTETVYGIGASSASCFGPQEIIDIKARPKNKPLPWLVEDDDALDAYGVDVPEYAHRIAKKFWPGALTIVVKAASMVAPEFRDDRGTVALRCPDHEVVMELIQASGGPIITTSANTSGKPPAGSFDELEERIIAQRRPHAGRRRDQARRRLDGRGLHRARARRHPRGRHRRRRDRRGGEGTRQLGARCLADPSPPGAHALTQAPSPSGPLSHPALVEEAHEGLRPDQSSSA